ncbi:MAG: hypothetical protein LBM99_02775 [Bacillales bacterium]|jgi:hypothetical protein|nr:hypothetical protein [Bacillales bacterium]
MTLIKGDLAERLKRNAQRLQSDIYKVPKVFEGNSDSWPGDWVGRAILALCCHYNTSHFVEIKKQLDEIINSLEDYINEDGYFGPVINFKEVSEQQLSGNSWYLRGLVEYYKISKDLYILELIKKVENSLLLKLKEPFLKYEVGDFVIGEVNGSAKQDLDSWKLSSDIGCAFILMDGITAVYELLPSASLKEIIEILIKKFLAFNHKNNNYQTHAYLSTLRGILRFANQNNDYLKEVVIKLFDVYLNFGMTLNYANYNWFGKPFWTETCCVVDSYILAGELFKISNELKYVTLMNRIYFNGIRRAQRDNGGAGCDTCLDSDNHLLKVYLYEAEFCCTMRLAEGLSYIGENLIINDTICLYNSFSNEKVKMVINRKEIKIHPLISLKLYLPLGVEGESKIREINKDYFIDIKSLSFHKEYNITYLGDIIYTRKKDGKYSPISNMLKEKESIYESILD